MKFSFLLNKKTFGNWFLVHVNFIICILGIASNWHGEECFQVATIFFPFGQRVNCTIGIFTMNRNRHNIVAIKGIVHCKNFTVRKSAVLN